jgi:hypothetical protein
VNSRATRISLLLATFGAVLLAVGLAVEPTRAAYAYLVAWTFGATLCIGALLLLMTGHAAKASWMVVTRRVTESIVDALPLYFVLFLPVCFRLGVVYPWAREIDPADAALAHAVEHKRAYLNQPFFVTRTIAYFAVFVVIGGLLRAWSKKNDANPRIALVHRMRRLSAGGLPLVGITLTWASFDWTMSLEPDWYSTIFGLYFFAGSFLGAIALVSALLDALRVRDPEVRLSPDHAQALGRLLFAMVSFWAYMAFSQLLIYWIGDIPDEVSYYRLRTTGSWYGVTYSLVLGHFVGPFFLLLNRHWKRNADYLAAVSGFVLLMHFVDVYWMILPVCDTSGARPHWLDLGAVLFVGGLSAAWVARRYRTAAPLPLYAPDLAEGLDYEASL